MNDNGGPAFPIPYIEDQRGHEWNYCGGMSLRDWFAGMALQAMITHEGVGEQTHAKNCSDCAYYYADAMIKKRSE